MKTRAVLFDLGNTLVAYYKAKDFMPVLERCVENLCDVLARFDKVYDRHLVFDTAKQFNVERKDLSIYPLNDRLQAIFELDNGFVRANDQVLSEAFLKPICDTAVVDPEAVTVLKQLKQRGFIIGIISNTPWGSPSGLWRKELERHGLLQYTDAAIFCVDAGRRKPHKLIFDYALDVLGIAANETIFVGDDPQWDVVGAESAGITAILLDPQQAFSSNTHITLKQLSQLFECL